MEAALLLIIVLPGAPALFGQTLTVFQKILAYDQQVSAGPQLGMDRAHG